MATPIIYSGRDNPIDRVFQARTHDGTLQLFGAELFTRFALRVGPMLFDSQLLGLGAGQPFDNTGEVGITFNDALQTVRFLRINLGGQRIPPDFYQARLLVFDGSHPSGLAWGKDFTVEVRA